MLAIFIGILTGLFGGLVGLGGSVIMIPLMVRFYRLEQHHAHGTSLVAVIFTGLAGTLTYHLQGSMDIMVLCLAAPAVLTARLGALFAETLSARKLRLYFGVFIFLVGLIMAGKSYLPPPAAPLTGGAKLMILLGSGTLAGLISGMMGAGGGSVLVPALVLLVGLNQHAAQGSALLAMIPMGLSGAYTHWRLGNVVTDILPGLLLGILLGAYLGGSLAHLLTEANLRLVFASIIILIGVGDICSVLGLKPPAPLSSGG
jgi:uncharacterized protein